MSPLITIVVYPLPARLWVEVAKIQREREVYTFDRDIELSMIYRIAITILGVKVEPLLFTSRKASDIKNEIARLTLLIYSII